MGRPIEFWFEFASTYSYLTAMRIDTIAAAAGAEILWKPFLLGPIFRAQGWNDSPFNLYPAKGRYMWRDMERLCNGYGLSFRKPSVFPRNGLLATRVALVAIDRGFGPAFVRDIYHANFADDREIGDVAVVTNILEALGEAPAAVLQAADTAENKQRLREQTEQAREAGLFGAPTLRVGDELFWGNDRLGDAVARATLGDL
ncbi:MAG: 2-hydroxychromene-2-carboxylate isomerase [bacterium]|nr:2-hydroxychromene-2-carboxylate isomerase [bacterium]